LLSLRDHVLSSESYAVRLTLALLRLPYERIAVDAYPGVEPVPVLRDDDVVLRDSGLILAHLARGRDPTGCWLPPEDAPEIARWLAFAATDFAVLGEARRVAIMGAKGDIDTLNAKGRAALRMLEDHLSERRLAGADWIAGEGPTVADIAVFPNAMLSHDSGIGHEDYPAINLWQRRLRSLDGFIGMPGIPDYY
jgi:glutathione S-transferase